jgi:hypothetical protein
MREIVFGIADLLLWKCGQPSGPIRDRLLLLKGVCIATMLFCLMVLHNNRLHQVQKPHPQDLLHPLATHLHQPNLVVYCTPSVCIHPTYNAM